MVCYHFQGIMKTIYVNKMVRAGCTVKILIADWFLQRNPRFTCNLNKIQAIIRYNIMMWKAVGMHLDKVEIIWFSDELNHHAVDYWPLAMNVSRKYTMKRMARYLYCLHIYSRHSFTCKTCSPLSKYLSVFSYTKVAALLFSAVIVSMWNHMGQEYFLLPR